MYKKYIIVLMCLLFTGCLMAKRHNPQPIVLRELSTLPDATKAGSLYMFAEEYVSLSGLDFSKAQVKAVRLTLQNTSSDKDDYATTHEFDFTDFHGIGNEEYEPYPYSDAYILIDNSAETTESVKGAALGAAGGGAMGAAVGAALGAIGGNAATGAALGAVIGGTGGGFKGHQHYKAKASIVVDKEIYSRKIPEYVNVQPGTKVSGIIFFPADIHTIRTNIESVNYNMPIYSLETIKNFSD